MPRTPTLLAGLALIALGGCAGPTPTGSPSPPWLPSPSLVVTADASTVVRLSGREVRLQGGGCTWFEGEGKLVVEIGPNAAGDYVRLTAPLTWTGDELPPGAASGEPALTVRLGGQDLQVDQSTITGEMATDAGFGSWTSQAVGGGPVTGEFDCPTVIDG